MQTEYVLGFCFTDDYAGFRRVMLIKKDSIGGKTILNGLGGKVEPQDRDVHDAMRREFEEEAGIQTDRAYWSRFAVLEYPDALVHCFVTCIGWKTFKHGHRTCEEGEVVSFQIDDKFYSKMVWANAVRDIHWLIPMANAACYDYPGVVSISQTNLPSRARVQNVYPSSILRQTEEEIQPTTRSMGRTIFDETFCADR